SGWTLPLLLLLCVVHTGFCYLLWFGSMDGLTTQTVALFSYIDPVTALLVSGLVLGETMTVLGWLGAVLILGAAILSGRE
ncbi:MAG: EamA family transporter, partial [Clostridia bacterium]|nr:EamA family transporter [Clostridia bacterium]